MRVEEIKPGDRVTVNPLIYSGKCHYCRLGQFVMCTKLGTAGFAWDGAFAELGVFPEYSILKLPETVSDDAGAFVEPLAVAVHAVKRARLKIGASVAVVGAVGDPPVREPVFSLITGHFRREVLDEAGLEVYRWEVVIVDSLGRVRGRDASARGMEEEIQNWPVRVRLSPFYLNELNVICEVLAGLGERWVDADPPRGREAVEIVYRTGRSYRLGAGLPVFDLFSRVLRPPR